MTVPAADEPDIDLAPPALKPVAGSPWGDDALQRQGIASELNTLVAELARGEDSATIALDGGYGTGKTFVLERWVREMRDQGRVAVYYNAWENDCDDDPLVSLIETLASDTKIKWSQATKALFNEALAGFLRKVTGADIGNVRKELTNGPTIGLLEAAAARRASRQKLKELLAELVDDVRDAEAFGVVVVIDELDRCRPTFATELLERVKHVLNVPGLVFVFGVNTIALRETVKAAYGDIDAHQYLLRIFTRTLHMPPGVAFHGREGEDRAASYVKYLADRHGLRAFCERFPLLKSEFSTSVIFLSLVASGGQVTPREMERIVWLLAKVASTSLQPGRTVRSMLPLVLTPLAVVRIRAPEVYYRAVSIPDQAPAVIDYLSELVDESKLGEEYRRGLDKLEMTMYRVCHQHPPGKRNVPPPAYVSLSEYAQEEGLSALDGQHLSRRLTHIDKERAGAILKRAPPEDGISEEAGIGLHRVWTFATLQRITSCFDVVWPREPAR